MERPLSAASWAAWAGGIWSLLASLDLGAYWFLLGLVRLLHQLVFYLASFGMGYCSTMACVVFVWISLTSSELV